MNSQNPHRLNNTIMRIKEHMPTWNTDKTYMQIHSNTAHHAASGRGEILKCVSKPVSPFEIATFVQQEKDRRRRSFATVVVRAADDTVRNNEANERTDGRTPPMLDPLCIVLYILAWASEHRAARKKRRRERATGRERRRKSVENNRKLALASVRPLLAAV